MKYYWAVWESDASVRYRFEWSWWPTSRQWEDER